MNTDNYTAKSRWKRSPAGNIPISWDIKPLGRVASVSYGISDPLNRSLKKGTPILAMPNITKEGYITLRDIPFVEATKVKNRDLLKKGDILFNWRSGSIGHLGKTAYFNLDGQYTHVGFLLRVRCNSDRIFPKYLDAYVKLIKIRGYFLGAKHQVNNTFNKAELETVPIAFPPLSEQKKIAEILLTWEEAIEQTRKLIEAKKHRKKALMQQLLTGKRRLQSHAKPKRKTSYPFFDLPEDWACPQIREIAQECSKRNTGSDNLPVLACSKHLGFVESSEYFGKRVFSEDTSNYKMIRRGQFGFPSNHVEEGSIGLLQKHYIALVSPIYTVFKCAEDIVPEYLYSVFKTDTFRHIFKVSTNASVDRRGSLRGGNFH